jgi:uncharacterized protein (TIGR03083 family)
MPSMADFSSLDGLDPYDLQDSECARLRGWFDSLDDAAWDVASGCEAWTRRDVLAHLLAVEEYFASCLAGSVAELMVRYSESGMATVADFGLIGVAGAAGKSGPELLELWTSASALNRAGFRDADGTDIDSSVGTYPGRLQAFHVAFEYGVHANDVDAPVDPTDCDNRQHWLASVGRFAITEIKEHLHIRVDEDRWTVTEGDTSFELNRDQFIAGVAARPATAALEPGAAALLDPGY